METETQNHIVLVHLEHTTFSKEFVHLVILIIAKNVMDLLPVAKFVLKEDTIHQNVHVFLELGIITEYVLLVIIHALNVILVTLAVLNV